MIPTDTYIRETDTYWNLIKDVRDEVKIRLITLLSESLSHSALSRQETLGNPTERFLKKAYGSLTGNETAEEIIYSINENKTCNPPVSFE